MKKTILYGVVASETIHIFCCVLPTILSVMSLLSGVGMVVVLPGFIDEIHHVIHHYEIPMLMTSGTILVVGWALYLYAKRIDCMDKEVGCCSTPCEPKKDRIKIVMIAATLLFIINVSVYFGFHVQSEMHIAHG